MLHRNNFLLFANTYSVYQQVASDKGRGSWKTTPFFIVYQQRER